jgi:hypothetical protein
MRAIVAPNKSASIGDGGDKTKIVIATDRNK